MAADSKGKVRPHARRAPDKEINFFRPNEPTTLHKLSDRMRLLQLTFCNMTFYLAVYFVR